MTITKRSIVAGTLFAIGVAGAAMPVMARSYLVLLCKHPDHGGGFQRVDRYAYSTIPQCDEAATAHNRYHGGNGWYTQCSWRNE